MKALEPVLKLNPWISDSLGYQPRSRPKQWASSGQPVGGALTKAAVIVYRGSFSKRPRLRKYQDKRESFLIYRFEELKEQGSIRRASSLFFFLAPFG